MKPKPPVSRLRGGPKVVETRQQSELERFASWFHQDYFLDHIDFREGASEYIHPLVAERRAALRRELAQFLDSHAGASPKAINRAWRKLGAQTSHRDLKDALIDALRALLPQSGQSA